MRRQSRRVASLVFGKRHLLATRDFGQSFIDIGLSPQHFVMFAPSALNQSFVNELAGAGLGGFKLAKRSSELNPGFPIRIENFHHDAF